MNKILLLYILFTLSCTEQDEIFPDSDVINSDQDFINQTIGYTSTLPTSIKVNYSSDFEFSFRSFDNSVFDLDSIFNSEFNIQVNSVYDSVVSDTNFTFVGRRNSTVSEYIINVFDTITMSTELAQDLISIKDIKKISSNVISVNESNINTIVLGDSLMLDESYNLYVALVQDYSYGDIDSIFTFKKYNRELLLELGDFVTTPDTLVSYTFRDSVETKRSLITANMYKDSTIKSDSTRLIFSNNSNIFNDSIIAYDSIIINKADSYQYCLSNIIDKDIFIEDSNTLQVNWSFFDTKHSLYESVIQNVTLWSLDSVSKVDSVGLLYDMRRPEEDFQDTITLVLDKSDTSKYEYYSKKYGTSLGIATSAKISGEVQDSIFVGNQFIYRDTINVNDTTNLYISHVDFEDYTGILTTEDGNFFVFEVNEDGTINKK